MVEIIGVVIAVGSPFAWIAYNHPAGFKRIYWPLFWIAGVIMLCVQIWSFAVTTAFSALTPFIKPDAIKAASAAIAAINPTSFWILLSFFAFHAYFSFLLWLHEILGIKQQQP
ncbi:hypothetical protein [Sphingobium yanoikuyae]